MQKALTSFCSTKMSPGPAAGEERGIDVMWIGVIERSDDLNKVESAKDLVAFTHGSLKVKSANVLPPLLHQRHQEVDCHSDVLSQVFFGLRNVSNSSSHAVHLLALELDSLLQFSNFGSDLLSLSQVNGELSHLHQHVSEQLGHLLTH